MIDDEGTEYTQCTRCTGWFLEGQIMSCYSHKTDKWLADLCKQCFEGWLHFEAFVGEYE